MPVTLSLREVEKNTTDGLNLEDKKKPCLEEKLVLSDSLDRFNQVGGDGVGKAMPLLDFL